MRNYLFGVIIADNPDIKTASRPQGHGGVTVRIDQISPAPFSKLDHGKTIVARRNRH